MKSLVPFGIGTVPRSVPDERVILGDLTIVEIASIGPGPFAGMMLSDLGARVVRVQRPGGHRDAWGANPVLDRGREVVEADLKSPRGVATVLDLVAESDALIEGFRPGVMERLGLGPAECHARRPSLVYGRMTGWGQDGPAAQTAGHDINYLATTGVLHAIGPPDRPVPPLNLLGDFGGGGLLLVVGVLAGVLDARRTGRGHVVDAAIVDGVSSLAAMIHGFAAQGRWTDERQANLLDGGAPFYDVYACADGGHVAVGALEEKFFRAMLDRLGLSDDPVFAGDRFDRRGWPAMRERLAATFVTRSRDQWGRHFAGTDCCVTPILSLAEAPHDPHLSSRATMRREPDGAMAPGPSPRFLPALD